ncbi:hypothetical protein AAH979_23045 [Plantactinospora sp. ZYX-F-223]|uniref:hypothetical protein n=1 Tax=Plantactinospora sp. ZYX-F-223 TaxID=3144103 RepID=UPI0031FC0975
MTEPYRDELAQQPLARAVLAKLAATRNAEDPVGSFARAVLNGDAGMRAAAAHSWHGQTLGPAFDQALKTLRELPADERDAIERQAPNGYATSETRISSTRRSQATAPKRISEHLEPVAARHPPDRFLRALLCCLADRDGRLVVTQLPG